MSAARRIGLGTAQFGLDYGITNSRGRVPEEEVRAILDLAAEASMDLVDTAHLYGGSERVLGRCLPEPTPLRLVTKTVKLGASATPAAEMLAGFEESLRRLERSAVYGLLFHDPADLLGADGPELWSCAEQLKTEGEIARIGVSIYEADEADRALDLFPLDLVQLPWNPLDRRLIEGGQLERLAATGVEIHARSLFLQGLLLEPVEDVPERFGPVRGAIAEMTEAFGAAGLSRLEGVLTLAFQRPEIDRFVCGVTSAAELQAIVLAAEKADAVKGAFSFTSSEALDPIYLNPARWPDSSSTLPKNILRDQK